LWLLLLRNCHVDVHLRPSVAEPTSPPSDYRQNDNHDKNHEYSDYTGAAAASTIIVGHIDPLIWGIRERRGLEGFTALRVLAQPQKSRQLRLPSKSR